MITLHWLYGLAGAMFAAFALLSAFDRANRKRFGIEQPAPMSTAKN